MGSSPPAAVGVDALSLLPVSTKVPCWNHSKGGSWCGVGARWTLVAVQRHGPAAAQYSLLDVLAYGLNPAMQCCVYVCNSVPTAAIWLGLWSGHLEASTLPAVCHRLSMSQAPPCCVASSWPGRSPSSGWVSPCGAQVLCSCHCKVSAVLRVVAHHLQYVAGLLVGFGSVGSLLGCCAAVRHMGHVCPQVVVAGHLSSGQASSTEAAPRLLGACWAVWRHLAVGWDA
jgi:hypothetical protein